MCDALVPSSAVDPGVFSLFLLSSPAWAEGLRVSHGAARTGRLSPLPSTLIDFNTAEDGTVATTLYLPQGVEFGRGTPVMDPGRKDRSSTPTE